MTTTSLAPPQAAQFPKRVTWTRETYRRAWEMGLFGESKVELVYGEVIEKMPVKTPHATVIRLLQGALLQIFTSGYVVDIQLPFVAADESEPEPDAAVMSGWPSDFIEHHPDTALLVVEVSDSTLAYDLGTKATLYAQSHVPEYWVADINAGLLHVHRGPMASPSFEGGYGYQSIVRLTRGDEVSPLTNASASIRVADLLPVFQIPSFIP